MKLFSKLLDEIVPPDDPKASVFVSVSANEIIDVIAIVDTSRMLINSTTLFVI